MIYESQLNHTDLISQNICYKHLASVSAQLTINQNETLKVKYTEKQVPKNIILL